MTFLIDEKEFTIIIERKNNKNIYFKMRDANTVYITASPLVSKRQIVKLLEQNKDFILKSSRKMEQKEKKAEEFYYLGNKYNIIFYPDNNIEFVGNRLYIKNETCLEKWLKKEREHIFKERLDLIYQNFEENIPYPKLKIRKMKTRWGVCNKRDNSITLNAELLRYDMEKIDYIIIHELSHFLHFDHSKNFWMQVDKYFPDYKRVRRELRN